MITNGMPTRNLRSMSCPVNGQITWIFILIAGWKNISIQ